MKKKKKKNKKNLTSIIIRTKNEEKWIDICLQKIFIQKKILFEVIIIDNCSSDKTVDKAKRYPIKLFKIKKFYPGKAINLGVSKSKGKYIVCLSAHCIPESDLWLFNLVRDLKNKRIAAVYGKQRPLPYSSSFDKRDLYNTFGEDKRIQIKDTFFHNANSAFRKEVWEKNKFDEHTPHIEDRIWANSIINKNLKIIYEPKASVFHWHGINHNMNKERCDKIVNILEGINIQNSSRDVHNLNNLNIVAIIPVKGESLSLNKKQMLENTISYANESKYIKKVFVSTDNKETKKLALNLGATAPFLRPKSLSASHIDIISTIKFTLNELEKNKIFPDLIVLMTENFPYRAKGLHDKMLKKAIDNNYDSMFVVKKEKGTVFHNDKLIVDGTVPNKLKEEKILTSRIGICTILRPEKIRLGSIFEGKIGTHILSDELSFLEVNKFNKKKLENLLI